MKTITIELPDNAEAIYTYIAFNGKDGQRRPFDYAMPDTEKAVKISYDHSKWEAVTGEKNS